MSTRLLIVLLIAFSFLLIIALQVKRKQMRHGEIAPAGVLKEKYNLTAGNHPVIRINPENVPSNLRDLISLAEKWGIGDDIIRVDFEEKATDSEKEELKNRLKGRTIEITSWLDSFQDDKAMTDEAGHFMFMLEALDEMNLWPD